MQDYLVLDSVGKKFGAVTALENISFKLEKGKIYGICGENGAGKSTLMKILSGVFSSDSYEGALFMKGSRLEFSGNSIQKAVDAGISIVHQELSIIPGLSVAENVYLGREPVKKGKIDFNVMRHGVESICRKYGFDLNSDENAGNLSVGKKQLVEIVRVLSQNAELIIFDEPTSALSEKESAKLLQVIRQLRESGVTVLYISHKLEEFFEIADSVIVLRDGTFAGISEKAELNKDKLVELMVGRSLSERFPSRISKMGGSALIVDSISQSYKNSKIINNISFDLKKGEVLGVAGLMGSGRSELVNSIFGVYGKLESGKVFINGEAVVISNVGDAVNAGIGLVPEDRKKSGLIVSDSILDNIALPNLRKYSSFFRRNRTAEERDCKKAYTEGGIKAESVNAPASSLSGGNQQKIVFAKWMMMNPDIFILDDPTRGIDVGAKYEIYKKINEMAEKGKAVIMISSELEELLGMCDRIMVMHEGECAGILPASEADQKSIMHLATGEIDE